MVVGESGVGSGIYCLLLDEGKGGSGAGTARGTRLAAKGMHGCLVGRKNSVLGKSMKFCLRKE
jgi:hypothetical protein